MNQDSNDKQPMQDHEVDVAPVQGNRTFLQRYGFPLVLIALCIALGVYLLISQNKEEELPVLQEGADFSFTDTSGNEVTLQNTNGKVRLLYFFFANCPDVCPPTTAILSQVQDELKAEKLFGSKVEFLSVSIDPTHDTTEALLDFADTFDADLSGWKFLRGEEAETHEIAKKYGVMAYKDKDGNFGHSNVVVLLDKNGNIREWISGMDFIGQGTQDLEPKDMVDIVKKIL